MCVCECVAHFAVFFNDWMQSDCSSSVLPCQMRLGLSRQKTSCGILSLVFDIALFVLASACCFGVNHLRMCEMIVLDELNRRVHGGGSM